MVQTQFSSSSVAADAEVFVLPTSTVRVAITDLITESGQAHRAWKKKRSMCLWWSIALTMSSINLQECSENTLRTSEKTDIINKNKTSGMTEWGTDLHGPPRWQSWSGYTGTRSRGRWWDPGQSGAGSQWTPGHRSVPGQTHPHNKICPHLLKYIDIESRVQILT